MPGSYNNHINTSNNHILSLFFEQKGDAPLSEVEYEGVLLLINKSADISRDIDTSRFDTSRFQDSKITNGVSRNIPISEHNDSQILNSTPSKTLLKSNMTMPNVLRSANTSVILTPDYTPVYHTINNSYSYPRSSIKRVYQFSGLPSPYKTRIRTPNLKKKDTPKVEETPQPVNKKPRSDTANALLSMLDEKADKKPTKKFTNPYGSRFKPQLSAKDINKTISFDKLGVKGKEENKESNGMSVPKSTFDFTFKGDNKDKSENEKTDGLDQKVKKDDSTLFGKNDKESTEGKENNNLFGKSENNNLFGKSENNNLFGKNDNSLFGKNDNNSLFGNKENNSLFGKKTDTTETTSLFGNKENTNLFGNKDDTKTPKETTNLFGNNTNLFGNNTSLFGNTKLTAKETTTLKNDSQASFAPSFGSAKPVPTPSASLATPAPSSSGSSAASNGKESSFIFPEVKPVSAVLDSEKVAEYKAMFVF